MINVGGSSCSNGIKFISTKYSAKFSTNKNITKIQLKKNEKEKTSKILNVLRKIPLLRGIVALIRNSKLLFFTMLFYIILDALHQKQLLQSNNYFSVTYKLAYWIIFVIMLFLFARIFRNIKATWQYHGAEHKVILTNYENKTINFKNCKKASRIADKCGTMLLSLMLFVYIITTILLKLLNINIGDSLILLIVWIFSYELFLLDRNTPVIRYIFKLGYWFQEHVCTLEPTDFQLKQAIETFNLLEKAETNQISNEELNEILKNGKQVIF